MKKVLAAGLILVLALSMMACGGKNVQEFKTSYLGDIGGTEIESLAEYVPEGCSWVDVSSSVDTGESEYDLVAYVLCMGEDVDGAAAYENREYLALFKAVFNDGYKEGAYVDFAQIQYFINGTEDEVNTVTGWVSDVVPVIWPSVKDEDKAKVGLEFFPEDAETAAAVLDGSYVKELAGQKNAPSEGTITMKDDAGEAVEEPEVSDGAEGTSEGAMTQEELMQQAYIDSVTTSSDLQVFTGTDRHNQEWLVSSECYVAGDLYVNRGMISLDFMYRMQDKQSEEE